MRYLCLFILALLPCYAQINQVGAMKEALEYFNGADKDTLAVFDIDNVIVIPSEPAFQMANMKKHSHICKKVLKEVPDDKKDVFMVLTVMDSEPVLLDPQIKALLDKLNEQKVPKMALTGNLTGKFRNIESMEDWKVESLSKLGIDFSQNAPHADSIVFEELPSYRDNFSMYKKGILFVNGSTCTKGDALAAFLKRTGLKPKKVVFVDDREEHVKSVESALQGFDPAIVYMGVHFTGAKDFPSKEISAGEFEVKWKTCALVAEKLN